jgi:hypothetical protein
MVIGDGRYHQRRGVLAFWQQSDLDDVRNQTYGTGTGKIVFLTLQPVSQMH